MRTPRIVRLVTFGAAAWAPPMVGMWLLTSGAISAPVALGIGLAGALAAVGLSLARARTRRVAKFITDTDTALDGTWARVANPRGHYANRWAMYEDLSRWLDSVDWKGKTVAELGGTNDVLRAFIRGARYVILEYPDHDVQDLRRVSDDQFDLAILDQTLEHVPDPERALAELRRVLKPGGIAIITTPFLVPVHTTARYGDYTRWTPQGLQTMLERCHFDADVRWWGNQAAARALLGDMYLTAAEATRRQLGIAAGDCEDTYPVTVWARATARK